MNTNTTPSWHPKPPKDLVHCEDPHGLYKNSDGFWYIAGVRRPSGSSVQFARGPFPATDEAWSDHKKFKETGERPPQEMIDEAFKASRTADVLRALLEGNAPSMRKKKRTPSEAVGSLFGRVLADILETPTVRDDLRREPYHEMVDEMKPVFGDDRLLQHTCGRYWHFDMVPWRKGEERDIVGEFETMDEAAESADRHANIGNMIHQMLGDPADVAEEIVDPVVALRRWEDPRWHYPDGSGAAAYEILCKKINWSKVDTRLGSTGATAWYFQTPIEELDPVPEEKCQIAVCGPFATAQGAYQAMALHQSEMSQKKSLVARYNAYKQRVRLAGDPANLTTNLGLLALILRGSETLTPYDDLPYLASALYEHYRNAPQPKVRRGGMSSQPLVADPDVVCWRVEGSAGFPAEFYHVTNADGIRVVREPGTDRYFAVDPESGSESPVLLWGPAHDVDTLLAGYPTTTQSDNEAAPQVPCNTPLPGFIELEAVYGTSTAPIEIDVLGISHFRSVCDDDGVDRDSEFAALANAVVRVDGVDIMVAQTRADIREMLHKVARVREC